MRDNSERCSHGRKVESMRPRELVAGGWLRRSVVGVALALPSGIAAADLSGWEIETEICRSGISVVGGSAALTLAVYHPDQFRYAGSFSGYLNISVPGMRMALRLALLEPITTHAFRVRLDPQARGTRSCATPRSACTPGATGLTEHSGWCRIRAGTPGQGSGLPSDPLIFVRNSRSDTTSPDERDKVSARSQLVNGRNSVTRIPRSC